MVKKSKKRSLKAQQVIDRAIQAHGGAGLCQDTFLPDAFGYVGTRLTALDPVRHFGGPGERNMGLDKHNEGGREQHPARHAPVRGIPIGASARRRPASV